MTTIHLGDCANSCATCSENYHSNFVGTNCDTCHEFILKDEVATCQLCGGEIKDINTAGVVLPWGDTCQTCLTEIYGENK